MTDRVLGALLTVLAFIVLATLPTVAQTVSDTPPQTPWGDPDLQGTWNYSTITPLERPDELAGKEFLTDEEAAAFERQTLQTRNKDRRPADGLTAEADVRNAYNQFWWDYGTKLTEDKRTSLIVDPPDGRIPPLTPEAKTRTTSPEAQRIEAARRGRAPARSWTDMDLTDRCVTRSLPRFPGAYNNNFQILQTPRYAVILIEMNHDTRIIPLDGRPHHNIRQWMGDSRGRWEGDTLVVETTTFSHEQEFRGMPQGNMHLVERFTRVDAETIHYETTIHDPTTWAIPWSAAFPMTQTQGHIFEYACHEGNYSMANLLVGSRAQEKAAAEAAKTESR